MKITWKKMSDPYISGESAYVGKWRVGDVYFDGMRRAETAPYTFTCLLPGLKQKNVGYATLEDAKGRLKDYVAHWFKQAEESK
jgi:hypothetical protein